MTLISQNGTVNLSNMPARSDVAVADKYTEALFEGVKDGSWHATSFETTPPVSIKDKRTTDSNDQTDVNVSSSNCKRRVCTS